MTLCILIQVFFRYVLDGALPWPEEAARALMIWMTALAAPSALRHGGFVAIDSLSAALPKRAAAILQLFLLLLATLVLYKLSTLAVEFFFRGFRSDTSTLRLPWNPAEKLKRAWVYLAMPVCFIGMLLVSIELIIGQLKQAKLLRGNYPKAAAMAPQATE